MDHESLDEGLREKLMRSKSAEEVLALAKEEGIELSDEDLEQVSGGWGGGESSGPTCEECGSTNVTSKPVRSGSVTAEEFSCRDCGYSWTVVY